MSISTVETALAEYVGDVLVNDCGRPVPDRVLRYHGTIPDDCCTAAGALAVSWTECYMTDRFPAKAVGTPCPSRLAVSLDVRYVVCWPVPDDATDVTTADYEQADEVAAMLADVADCVSRALMLVKCRVDSDVDPLVRALFDETGMLDSIEYNGATPIRPLGGCVGVLWRVYCLVRNAPVIS